MGKKYGTLIICASILVLCFTGTASAETWYVDDNGGADFTRIQDAINKASDGDRIIVYSGIYYENVVVDKLVILKGIGYPIVDAGGEGSAFTLTADGITLIGFTTTNSGSMWSGAGHPEFLYKAGIRVISSNNNTITGNNVHNNNWHGIRLSYSSNNIITGNNASNNNGDGIRLSYSSNNIITGNNVSNNDDGIELHDSSNNIITGNNVSNNNWGGIDLHDSNNNTITGNNVSNNNWGGIDLESCSNSNTITGNNVSNNDDNGISLSPSSNNNTITGNVFVNDGLVVYSFYQNIVEDNKVNGKPLVYLEDVSDYKVEDAGQVIIVNCNNITIEPTFRTLNL